MHRNTYTDRERHVGNLFLGGALCFTPQIHRDLLNYDVGRADPVTDSHRDGWLHASGACKNTLLKHQLQSPFSRADNKILSTLGFSRISVFCPKAF